LGVIVGARRAIWLDFIRPVKRKDTRYEAAADVERAVI